MSTQSRKKGNRGNSVTPTPRDTKRVGNYQVPTHIQRMVNGRQLGQEEYDDIEELLEIRGEPLPTNTIRHGKSALAQRTQQRSDNGRYTNNSHFGTQRQHVREFAQIINPYTFYEGATALLSTKEYIDMSTQEIYSLAEINQIKNKAIVAFYIEGDYIDGSHKDFKAIQERVGNDGIQLTQAVREFFEEDTKKSKYKERVSNDYIQFKNKANQVFLACLALMLFQGIVTFFALVF